MATHILAVDQGTTGTTALVVDPDGRVAGSASTELAQFYPRPGWVEHDPAVIWRDVIAVASRAVHAAGLAPTDIAALGITNQRETTLMWDRASGEPVANAIVWQDRRTAEACRRLEADGLGEVVRARTGLLLDPYFSATKVAWLLQRHPDLARRARRGELAFGTVDSWLLWKLTGGRVHATDVTNASRTMLMDLRSLQWDGELAGVFGVPAEVLPMIMPSEQVFGETCGDFLGGHTVPIAGVLGDQQSALFAQGCFSAGQTKNTYGTGSFVLQHAGTTVPPTDGPLLATVATAGVTSPPAYALEGSIFVTGAAVQWLRDGLGIITDAADTEALAAGLSGNDDVWFVPALTGLGAPIWDPFARGTLLGLTRGTTRAHIARAVLESIAYQTRDVLEAMTAGSGRQVGELRVDGGGCANRWLMQFQADVLGVPVDVAETIETTSLGCAYAAGLVVGVWADRADVEDCRRSGRRYEPGLDRRSADELYARWCEAVGRSRDWARPERGNGPPRPSFS